MKYFALLAVLVLALACGSKSVAPTFDGESNGGTFSANAGSGGVRSFGTSGSGGKGGAGGATGGEAGAVEGSPLAPTVEITSPQAVADPTIGAPLTGLSVTVTCSATKSKDPAATAVLPASVTIQMLGADGKQIGTDGSIMSTGNADEYTATFVLNGVPTGAVSFTCSATDQGTTVHQGQATVSTFFDGGPTIAITSPADKSAHSLGPVLFAFSALPAPLVAGDQGATVDAVTLSVNGVPITAFSAMADMAGYYQGSVDLSDATMFTPTPAGSVPVIIKATNKRGTTATGTYSFVVDSVGPVITIISPPTNSVQFIGHQTDIQFTVVDEVGGSGIDPSSVTVTINTADPIPYQKGNNWLFGTDGKTFDFTFHTEDYPTLLGESITISARDLAGNVAKGVSAFYYVDTVPPIIDLQPPNIQEAETSGNNVYCSEAFDPLGDSPKDLDVVLDVSIFRAMLYDVGNDVDSKNGISFFSDIDTAVGVRMYFQQDTSTPLLKYTGTGTAAGAECNDIADHTLPFISLTPVPPAGSSYFDGAAPIPSDYACTDGSVTTPPIHLCNQNSSLTRVIQHDTATAGTSVPVIYAFQHDDGALCTGGQVSLSTKVTKDGWLCVSVLAQDKIGNVAVSAPIRLCLDAPDGAGPGFVGSPTCLNKQNPPTCVAPQPAGCVPPPHFSKDVMLIP
jgi:hypothetical protein